MNDGKFAAFENLGVRHTSSAFGTAASRRKAKARALDAEILSSDADGAPPACAWFARCTNAATGTTPHPVLGDVPTCDRCAAFARGER